jgi:DNA-binding MarR family transcriptional regulator
MNGFDHDGSFGHVLGRTSRAMLNMLQKMFTAAGFDITVEQWTLLINIRNAGCQFQQQIAESVYRDKTTVARLAGGLEKKGLIRRSAGGADRRHKRVEITDRGLRLLECLKPLALEAQAKALGGLDRDRLDQCRETLIAIYTNILDRGAGGREGSDF